VAIEKEPLFIFDREETESHCQADRLTNKKDNGQQGSEAPWKMRQVAIQNITLNLPGWVIRPREMTVGCSIAL